MAKLTVVQSAKAGYAARPTIYKDIKGGKVSTEKTSKGTTVIDESELQRFYGVPTPKTPKEKVSGDQLAAAQKEEGRRERRGRLHDSRLHGSLQYRRTEQGWTLS